MAFARAKGNGGGIRGRVLALLGLGEVGGGAAGPAVKRVTEKAGEQEAKNPEAAAAASEEAHAALGRPVPDLNWSNISHIIERHWPGTATSRAGKFAEDITGSTLRDLVTTAIRYGSEQPNLRRPGTIYEYEFAKTIGTDIAGAGSTTLRVVVEAVNFIRTAYPI